MSAFANDGFWRNLRRVPSPSLSPARLALSLPFPASMPRFSARPNRATPPTVLVFDSGLGGLTVFGEIRKARPDARFVYVADDARFPYGAIPDAELKKHVVALMGDLIAVHKPHLVVIACNTASTLVLAALRERYDVPFVGTVPAIKPACAASVTKVVTVIGTEATVAREYTNGLIRDFAGGCTVTLVGSRRLAVFAEHELSGDPAADGDIAAEIAPCFVTHGERRTDTVVLACTHFPLLTARLERLAPWPVRWIDPAPAIARRVISLLGPAGPSGSDVSQVVFTSGRPPVPALMERLRERGLRVEVAA